MTRVRDRRRHLRDTANGTRTFVSDAKGAGAILPLLSLRRQDAIDSSHEISTERGRPAG